MVAGVGNMKKLKLLEGYDKDCYAGKVTALGNGAMVKSYKKYLGRKVLVLIQEEEKIEMPELEENPNWNE